MAGRFKVMRSKSTGTEGGRRNAELTSAAIQKFLRMERTNGESEKVDRKRKLEAIVVDGDIGEIRVSRCVLFSPFDLKFRYVPRLIILFRRGLLEWNHKISIKPRKLKNEVLGIDALIIGIQKILYP